MLPSCYLNITPVVLCFKILQFEAWLLKKYDVFFIVTYSATLQKESDTRAWQHFPLAIEGPPELWRTLAGYSHDPLYRTSDE